MTMGFLWVQSRRLEYVRLQPKATKPPRPTIVMLHEGLGSIAMWKEFPQQVADATGCEVVVYSRYGYGNSDPFEESLDVDFMHREALEALPDLLDKLQLKNPILFGHSDGGSIALIHAGTSQRGVTGVILLAPHVKVEQLTVTSIAAAREAYLYGNLGEKLARYHANLDSAFRHWADIWLHPEFLHWNIEDYLPPIACPVLAIQGVDDEYGTMEQIDIIGRAVKDVELLKLPQCGHSPHRDQPQAVLKAVAAFVERIAGRGE